MKHFSYLNTATGLIGLYQGKQPFHLFIKDFFRQHKKYGSRDRKQITHLCYCYFRLGLSLQHLSINEKILTAVFLCSDQFQEILAAIKPDWNEKTHLSVEEKCTFLNIAFDSLSVFPCIKEISDSIPKKDFVLSHFKQPDVFLRIRPGHQQQVLHKLQQQQIAFGLPYEDCLSLPNATNIDGILDLNKEVVIQDYSSQRTGSLMRLVKTNESSLKTWDCCAASGGKSILAKDMLGNIDLTVSDIRESVLINLKKRFSEAGITHYKTLITDLSAPIAKLQPASFQLIIADVPCTGSGTWGRTPERLSYFAEKEIETYSLLQKRIVRTVMPYLKKDGFFLYITCSVFKKENEDMLDFIRQNFPLEIIQTEILKGYDLKADTMFASLLRKV